MRRLSTHLALLGMIFHCTLGFAAGVIQDNDIKSSTDIKAAVLSTTGNLTLSNACISSIGSTTGLTTGLYIYDSTNPTYISPSTTIAGIPGTCSAGQVQMSSTATHAATGDTITFGGQLSQLPNDTKMWLSALTPAQQLSAAISSGVIGAPNTSKNYLTIYTPSLSSGVANIGNGDFEFGTTTGWSLAHSALTSLIPTSVASAGTAFDATHGGSAASGNLSITSLSIGQLQKTYSGSLVSSAASTAGDMLISKPFFIDAADQAKSLAFKFAYNLNAGSANTNFSGTSSNTFAVYIYDVSGGAWIQPAGVYNLTQNSGTGYATGTFQTTATGTQYQIAIVNTTASSGSYTLYVDDFSVGPQVTQQAPAMSDWVSYTPTGTWTTNVTYTGQWRRIGDSAEVWVKIVASGAPTSAALTVNLPSGLVIDTTKVNATSDRRGTLGTAMVDKSGTAIYPSVVAYTSTTAVSLLTLNAAGTYANGTNIDQATPVTFASGDGISMFFHVPIVGWSSNTSMSADTDTRVVAAFLYMNAATQSISSSTRTKVALDTALSDTHGAFSSTNNNYVIPVSGFYKITGFATFNSAASGVSNVSIKQNSSQQMNTQLTLASGNATTNSGDVVIKASAGDTIELDVNQTSGGSINILGGAGLSTNTALSIVRLSGPAVVAATESVNLHYHGATATVTGSDSALTYSTKDFDTHGAYSGSTFTAPVSGKYQINASAYVGATYTLNQYVTISIYKNGSNYVQTLNAMGGSVTISETATVSDVVSLVAGDTIVIKIASTGTSPVITANNAANFLSITRVGN